MVNPVLVWIDCFYFAGADSPEWVADIEGVSSVS
jgi:hypothetical protein